MPAKPHQGTEDDKHGNTMTTTTDGQRRKVDDKPRIQGHNTAIQLTNRSNQQRAEAVSHEINGNSECGERAAMRTKIVHDERQRRFKRGGTDGADLNVSFNLTCTSMPEGKIKF
ncbi:uncharacterized protein TRUGW13939_00572 [Talaromyces rugulosus]|uniref:Uncharacterized protein n=1 Tax=Talaromyces rugulosus TaxID=121627 RepID=A0A7H8QJU7_TALRU|nr:uncharacterized protein TRUGW13939_00572 [Talaromyces rugulosus]QKX53493.1 hypothetical protein TRUGW13939_00572 [Talaromyces rugulosus]